jgi:hypothetical protein
MMASEWQVEDEADEYSLNGQPLRTYTNKDCVQFVKDMEAAGFEVEHYHGRYMWEGPAVRVDELLDVAKTGTQVRLQHDNMGLGWIVYPKASDNGGVA